MTRTGEHTLEPDDVSDELVVEDGEPPIEGAQWYRTTERGATLTYEIEPETLSWGSYITYDLLLDGCYLSTWALSLHEADSDRVFHLTYGALNQCEARVRAPVQAADQNRWMLDREGAWLKPICRGDRVDPAAVDRITIRVTCTNDEPTRWCQTPLTITAEEPDRLTDPTLPEGPLLDEFGQSTIHEWDGRTPDEQTLVERITEQHDTAGDGAPADRSDWGGDASRSFEATGFFRTEHDGDRWWLVDPDGHPFWSAGLDCVRVYCESAYEGIEDALSWMPDEEGEFADAYMHRRGDRLNYLATNMIRAFGAEEWRGRWADVALGQLRELGFNTVGNWSEWEDASEAGVPYVRPLSLRYPETPTIYRDFPDVYDDRIREDAATIADPLAETSDDPALIGYFLGNEPTWGFADETPAAGMLYTTETCATREELASWARARYEDDAALADAWHLDVTFDDLAHGEFEDPLTDAAREDLEEFSQIMVDRLYRILSEACREVDPDHLNLGTRYAYVPGDWALAGMHHVDVFSINCYSERVNPEYEQISDTLDLPVLIGEWHFGALDVGLPASGIGRVPDQAARGDAYRVYLEDAAAKPWCVGTHYFTLYDQSAVGRFDGEHYNIGFLDVCHRPYPELAAAAQESHDRLYDVATGEADPYDDEPEYLNRVYL